MADLKKVFEALGFKGVQTYVQSSNVIFDCEPTKIEKMFQCIEKQLHEIIAASQKVIIRTQYELARIIENNPLVRRANAEPDKLHVTFLSGTPDETVASKLDLTPDAGEMVAIVGREVYLYCPNGYARTKLNNAIFESKLKTIATTRNWRTVNKLIVLST
jgi:uncharacterized protein (DUF1697 family)